MKCIEQVDAYIKNLKDKPTKRVEKAAQSFARKLDDALTKGYDIKWKCYPIENSQAVSIVDVTKNPHFVYRINNKQEWNEVCKVFDQITEMNVNQSKMYIKLMDEVYQAIFL